MSTATAQFVLKNILFVPCRIVLTFLCVATQAIMTDMQVYDCVCKSMLALHMCVRMCALHLDFYERTVVAYPTTSRKAKASRLSALCLQLCLSSLIL